MNVPWNWPYFDSVVLQVRCTPRKYFWRDEVSFLSIPIPFRSSSVTSLYLGGIYAYDVEKGWHFISTYLGKEKWTRWIAKRNEMDSESLEKYLTLDILSTCIVISGLIPIS